MRWIAVAALVASLPSLLAAQATPDRVPVNPSGSPVGPFTPAIKTMGGLIWVSGQIGNAPGTRTIVPGGVAAEARQALENLGRVLEAAGSSYARVVKCTVFLTDINDWAAVNTVYAPFFPTDPPARSAVAVAGLVFGAHVEFECVAVGS
jgi:2-iminobutanoate/2-iminopropanoate deaminase